jgi:hypothetical protein
MLDGQIQQVATAQNLHPPHLNEIGGEHGRGNPEREGADQPIAQRLLLIAPRQAEDHHGQDERVVRAQQPFEDHQHPDGHEIRELDVHSTATVT